MKIVFVLTNFFFEDKGGAELQVYYLAKELLTSGNEVYYIRQTGFENRKKQVFNDITLLPILTNKFFRFAVCVFHHLNHTMLYSCGSYSTQRYT